MIWVNSLQRWTMRGIHAAVLGAALLGSASVAFAQTPAAAASPVGKHYTKSRSFDLPVKMDQDFRLTLKEIRLYVKTPTGPWALQESISPYEVRFACKVPQDGEYWYSLVTVDRSGRMSPADLNIEPVSQKVVVDTVPPQIQVVAAPAANGELSLRCTVLDANPDMSTLRAVCKTEFGEIPLDTVPNEPGVFRVKGAEMLRHPVIITVKDYAKNEGTERVNLRDVLGQSATPGQAATQVPVPPPAPKGPAETFPPPLPGKAPDGLAQATNRAPLPPVGVDPIVNKVASPPHNEVPPMPLNPPPVPPDLPVRAPANLPSELPGKAPAVPHQLINSTQASIEYRIDHVGSSGLGKVEIFMTPDNGQTWHRLAEDTAKRSPAEIKLPGDGVYGIRIVVTNGNGFGGQAPVRGDLPHCTVEVDTTAPFVQLRSAELLPGAGHIEIRWNATDKNLGAEPITLHYRTRPDEAWKVIARNVKNDGLYRWAFPRDVGSQFHFKIDVADLAGNTSQAASHQPITIDMSEPRATIVGVSGGGTVLPR